MSEFEEKFPKPESNFDCGDNIKLPDPIKLAQWKWKRKGWLAALKWVEDDVFERDPLIDFHAVIDKEIEELEKDNE